MKEYKVQKVIIPAVTKFKPSIQDNGTILIGFEYSNDDAVLLVFRDMQTLGRFHSLVESFIQGTERDKYEGVQEEKKNPNDTEVS